jgi:hypothetical protein
MFDYRLKKDVNSDAAVLNHCRIVGISLLGSTIMDDGGRKANLASATRILSTNLDRYYGKVESEIAVTIEPPTCFDPVESVIYADGRVCGKDVEFERRHSRRAAVDQPSAQSIPEANSPSTGTKPRTRQKSKDGAPARPEEPSVTVPHQKFAASLSTGSSTAARPFDPDAGQRDIKAQAARKAIREAFPNGIPPKTEIPDKLFCKAVRERLSPAMALPGEKGGMTTILRSANRKK